MNLDGPISRKKLVHEGDVSLAAQIFRNPAETFPTAGITFRKNEMADDKPPDGNALFIKLQLTNLPEHFPNGGPVVLTVAGAAENRTAGLSSEYFMSGR